VFSDCCQFILFVQAYQHFSCQCLSVTSFRIWPLPVLTLYPPAWPLRLTLSLLSCTFAPPLDYWTLPVPDPESACRPVPLPYHGFLTPACLDLSLPALVATLNSVTWTVCIWSYLDSWNIFYVVE
jgi:hypothetical protein